MFGGKIAKKGKMIEGTHHQNAWDDTWLTAHPISYDGELTEEVCKAIKKAFYRYHAKQSYSSWGKLRWMNPPSIKEVDVDNRQLIVHNSQGLCD